MNRRTMLGLGASIAVLALPVTRAVTRLARRVVGGDEEARLVQVGGQGGPVITVIPLPENGFSGGDDLAG